jgi:hypothetical protein
MASASVTIGDYSAALADGTIPGAFGDGRRGFTSPEVISTNSHGATLVWSVGLRLFNAKGVEIPIAEEYLGCPPRPPPPGAYAEIATRSYQISAAGRRGDPRAGGRATRVAVGKNLGKKNETTVVTQAFRDLLGRFRTQSKRAASFPGAAGPPPMLVKRHGDGRAATLGPPDFARGVTAQRKLNGVRVVAFLGDDKRVVLYSRKGIEYPGADTIRAELAPILGAAPPGLHLDGEIYLHGRSLQEISGQARGGAAADDLEYHVFDCFGREGDTVASRERQQTLDRVLRPSPHVQRVENFRVGSLDEIESLLARFLKEGYEGLIARKDDGCYQYGNNNFHSSNVIKFKPIHDAEFEVVGYAEGARGTDKGALIWICRIDPATAGDLSPDDLEFGVVPKNMTYPERYRLFTCLGETVPDTRPGSAPGALTTRFERDVRGKPLTVEFPERTMMGKPAQAKALTFRTYEEGPDPLAELFKACRLGEGS